MKSQVFTGLGAGTLTTSKSGLGSLRGKWDAMEVLNGLTNLMPLAAQVGASIGLYRAGKRILDVANASYVPVTSGALVESGKVVGEGGSTSRLTKTAIASYPVTPTSSYSATIVYEADYAYYVHENVNALHGLKYNQKYKGKPNWKKFTETSKFIEKAIESDNVGGQFGVANILATALRESFRRILKNPRRYGYAPSDPAVTAVRQGMSFIRQTGW